MKRFYNTVTVGEETGGWRVLLDGRGIKTAAGAPQVVPAQALAQELAAEWATQPQELDLSRFPLRDLTDYVLDVVAAGRDDTVADLLRYAETDTLCYRADPDEPLHRHQVEVWEPLLVRAEARFSVCFVRVSGILHKPQPSETLAVLRTELHTRDAFTLAALRMLASLSASLTIALLSIERGADIAGLWAAASLEEEWQADLWGRDDEAEDRRKQRFNAFALAARFSALAGMT